MVITGLTRNQFASNRTRVRIPLSPPENDKFRQKLVVFSYIRLTASYMHLRCVIFASQVICLRALGANIISLKP